MDQFKSLLYLTPSLYILRVIRLPGVRSKLPSLPLQADRTIYASDISGYLYKSTNSGTVWNALPSAPVRAWTNVFTSLDGNRVVAGTLGVLWTARLFPTPEPTPSPTFIPTARPTSEPTVSPTTTPTSIPTIPPLVALLPTGDPSSAPTFKPSDFDDLHHLRDDEGRGGDREIGKGNGKESDGCSHRDSHSYY